MTPKVLAFRIQTQDEGDQEVQGCPPPLLLPDTPELGLTTSVVTNTDSPFDGAAIIHDSSLPGNTGFVPYVGPIDDNVL